CFICSILYISFFFQAEDGIRDRNVTGVQTCALPISDITFKHVKEGDGGKSYIRFDDGTQICHVHTVLTYSTSRTMNTGGDVNFAKGFVGVPNVVGSIDTREEERGGFALEELSEPYIYYVTETSFRVGIKVFKGSSGSFSRGDELGFNVMAIGRWK